MNNTDNNDDTKMITIAVMVMIIDNDKLMTIVILENIMAMITLIMIMIY